MASNDMNSWGDDDPDELLRRHWQRAFTEFDVHPRSSLSRRILTRLPTGRRHRPIRWLAGGLFLLITAGLWYRVGFRKHLDAGDKVNLVQSISPSHQWPNSRTPQLATAAERPLSPEPARANSRLGEITASQRPTVHQLSASRLKTSGGSASQVTTPPVETGGNFLLKAQILAKRADKMEQLAAGNVGLRGKTRKTVEGTPTLAGRSLAKPTHATPDPSPDKPSGPVRNERIETEQAPIDVSASQDTVPAPQVAITHPLVGTLQLLRMAGLLSPPTRFNVLPDQLPLVALMPRHLAEDNGVRPTQRWFINAVPLSSFQWMSALPASASYLSQVQAPAAFSPATWGYQVNGGVRFGRWQVHLSMGQLRRWAYYTVNENRYRVEPNLANPYHLVRETHTVAENVALPMVGTGLSQYQLLGQGRYIAELGTQVSYLPTSRQTLLGVRGGVSRRLPLSRRMELQAGLLVEYGLNRLLSEQRQLAIHPVVVGFGVQIQPRLEKPQRGLF